MEIVSKHIRLTKFLEIFNPISAPDPKKITLEDKDFMLIASLLKISSVLARVK